MQGYGGLTLRAPEPRGRTPFNALASLFVFAATRGPVTLTICCLQHELGGGF